MCIGVLSLENPIWHLSRKKFDSLIDSANNRRISVDDRRYRMFHQLQSRPYGLTEKVHLYNAARGCFLIVFFDSFLFVVNKWGWGALKKNKNKIKVLEIFLMSHLLIIGAPDTRIC